MTFQLVDSPPIMYWYLQHIRDQLHFIAADLAVTRHVHLVQEAMRRQKELEQVERQNAAAVVASPGPQATPHFPVPAARPHSARSARFAEGELLVLFTPKRLLFSSVHTLCCQVRCMWGA